MIKVSVYFEEDVIKGFHIEGHADYEEKGKDIICAAISTLSITCVNSIEELTDEKFVLDSSDDGMIDFMLTNTPGDEAKLLLKAFYLGVKGVANEYGKKFVRIYDC